MTATATKEPTKTEDQTQQRTQQLPALHGPRLPYHPLIGERFGIGPPEWKALVEAIFPGATTIESVALALSYCKARKLDPFKRVVHIVPIWDRVQGRMVDTVWPGIGELRTTAFRTGEYAGRDASAFGQDITQKVGNVDVTFPEWGQVTVYRIVKGQRVAFSGPRVYWLETYAVKSRNDDSPNEMWATRPRGQLDKCSEAAALRAAFPEEIGSDYIPEEVQHRTRATATVEGKAVDTLDDLAARLEGPSPPVVQQTEETEQTTEPVKFDLEGAQAGFNTCTELSEVGKFEIECDGLATTDTERSAISGMAEAARERVKTGRPVKSAGKQSNLAGVS